MGVGKSLSATRFEKPDYVRSRQPSLKKDQETQDSTETQKKVAKALNTRSLPGEGPYKSLKAELSKQEQNQHRKSKDQKHQ